jgi:hypothetical protein
LHPQVWHSGVLNSSRELVAFIEACAADRRTRRSQQVG